MGESLNSGQYQGVIFDLDGTLLDTIEDIADAMNAALATMDLLQHTLEDYKRYVGDGVEVLARRVLPESHWRPATIQQLVDLMLAEYQKNWDAKTKPYPGIEELLGALVQRGMKLAVLSNKPHPFTLISVERYFADVPFQEVLGRSEEVPPKPDLTGARRILDSFGEAADSVLYVGDTNTDMQTAVGAGFFGVGVAWGFRAVEELREHGARKIIEHPLELLDLT